MNFGKSLDKYINQWLPKVIASSWPGYYQSGPIINKVVRYFISLEHIKRLLAAYSLSLNGFLKNLTTNLA